MKNWEMYDKLIAGIPSGIKVEGIYMGDVWTVLLAEGYQGIAVTINEGRLPLKTYQQLKGKDLREAATLIKSWDFMDATVGMAAINAYYNREEKIRAYKGNAAVKTSNTFDDYAKATKDKAVAVIGHFIALERVLTEAASLDVLERDPAFGDLPDSACEYILPQKEFIFITGSAMINKTLPRLLEICKDGKAIVMGPSTPMSPVLFEYGADEVSGILLDRPSSADLALICSGEHHLSNFGKRIRLVK